MLDHKYGERNWYFGPGEVKACGVPVYGNQACHGFRGFRNEWIFLFCMIAS